MTYRPGQPVRVATRPHEGHHRTPGYLKGKVGRVFSREWWGAEKKWGNPSPVDSRPGCFRVAILGGDRREVNSA